MGEDFVQFVKSLTQKQVKYRVDKNGEVEAIQISTNIYKKSTERRLTMYKWINR